MEKFLADYGLKWIGEDNNNDAQTKKEKQG
jgi:hypothetical protein